MRELVREQEGRLLRSEWRAEAGLSIESHGDGTDGGRRPESAGDGEGDRGVARARAREGERLGSVGLIEPDRFGPG